MAKRSATSELNHDNWDQEEESEDPGIFKSVGETELKNRVIKKAKRSFKTNNEGGSSPFAAFGGFVCSSSSENPFKLLQNASGKDANSCLFNSNIDKEGEKKNGNSDDNQLQKSNEMDTASSNSSSKPKPKHSIEYYRHLQSLNESVMNWMQLHLSKNSCCDFTPVFNDYTKHLDTLNVTYPVQTREPSEQETKPNNIGCMQAFTESSNSSNAPNHVSQKSSKKDETDYGANFSSNTTNTSTFSFGIKRTPSATSSRFSGPNSSSREEAAPPEKKPFQFSSFGSKDSTSTFSFAINPSEKTTANTGNANDDVEYVPPKNDFVSIKEEDAFYSKRCKLFYKKDDEFVERGIGILHLKPLDGKTQLLIRADTTLGNILLNIVLSQSIPLSKTGKNNVLLVCVPNPPLNAKDQDSKTAIPMLIRVKTSEDADELLDILNKHKS